jgi:hypothetical protein
MLEPQAGTMPLEQPVVDELLAIMSKDEITILRKMLPRPSD